MAAPKIEADQKEQAKESNSAVWQLWIDRKYKSPGGGASGFSGVLSPECEDELMVMVKRWMKEGRI